MIRLVSAFVQRFIEGKGEDVTVFVFSEYGVTSVEALLMPCVIRDLWLTILGTYLIGNASS